MTGRETHARWLRTRWPGMSAEQIARAWETGSERLRAAWEAVAQPEPDAAKLRSAVEAHEPTDGMVQWYVDEHVIDCDAGEFWAVITSALDRP